MLANPCGTWLSEVMPAHRQKSLTEFHFAPLDPPLQGHKTEIIIELKAVSLSKKINDKRVMKTKNELEKHMKKQLEIAMDQLESRQYYLKSRDYVTTVHEFGICFAGTLCLVGSRTRTRKKDGADWTGEKCTVPSAQFQESEVEKQTFDATVEEKIEERDEFENREPTAGSSSHHAAMEMEQTGAASSRKRNSSQRGTCDYRIFDA